jgi:predicted enzyme related to lactoylglutathione lyase
MTETKSNLENNHKINYVEFVSSNIERSKHFYSTVFGWSFEDWGARLHQLQRSERWDGWRFSQRRSADWRAAGGALCK